MTTYDPAVTGSGIKRWVFRGEWRADTLRTDLIDKLAARSIERFKQAFEGAAPGFVGRLIDTLVDLFARAKQDVAKPQAQHGSYEVAETIRQALLKIISFKANQYPHAGDHRYSESYWSDVIIALQGFEQRDGVSYSHLLWADRLSTQSPHQLRDAFSSNHILDLYVPILEDVDAFAQTVLNQRFAGNPNVLNTVLSAFRQKIRAKLRYDDLPANDLGHADLTWALYAIAAECLTPAQVETLIATLPLLDLCKLLAYAFREDANKPYRSIREGGYRISQAVLRMANQPNSPFTDAQIGQARREVEHLVRCLRSNFYTDTLINTRLIPAPAPLTATQLATIIDQLETDAITAAQTQLTNFVPQVTAVVNTLAKTLAALPATSDRAHALNGSAADFTWFTGNSPGSWGAIQLADRQHVFAEFLRIFGFRVLNLPELGGRNGLGPEMAVLGYQQIIRQLRELAQPTLQNYLAGIRHIVFTVPTAGKRLEDFTYVESSLENLQQWIETVNYPPLTYRRRRTAGVNGKPADRVTPASANPGTPPVVAQPTPNPAIQLRDFPFLVFDQSDAKNVPLFQQNQAYLQALAGRMGATIHHVSMQQVAEFGKLAGIGEMLGTTQPDPAYWNANPLPPPPPEAGYGGARNIVFLVGPAFQLALKRAQNPVANFAGLIALGSQSCQRLIGEAISQKTMIMMGDDDLTLMPGSLHAKALLAHQFQTDHVRIVTRMIGRNTTKVPSSATKLRELPNGKGLNVYRQLVKETMQATSFLFGIPNFVVGGFTWHNFAGVVMHLGSCLDLPLPSEEKLFATSHTVEDILGLSIHHPGDRFEPPAQKMPAMANYVAQIRMAAALTHPASAPQGKPYILIWNQDSNAGGIRASTTHDTLHLIYEWIVQPNRKREIQKAFLRALFLDYLLDRSKDTMLDDDPAAFFGQIRTRLPELASRPELGNLHQELTDCQNGYTTLWNDIKLGHTYRTAFWSEVVALFKQVLPAQRNPAWGVINTRLGANVPPLDQAATNMDLVDWLVDQNVDFTPAITNTRTATNTGNRLDTSKVAKNVFLISLSFAKGRFFNLLTQIKNMGTAFQQAQVLAQATRPRRAASLSQSQAQSIFPHMDTQFSQAYATGADQPILINGMKVIFDQTVSVYSVTLVRKESVRQVKEAGYGRS
ncbi:MAG: hypothetical protein MUF72_04600 [Elainella sp. Prado103]|nr:hypothetical protein [Elainella sp. Prado103]